jgi:hypothetical protein
MTVRSLPRSEALPEPTRGDVALDADADEVQPVVATDVRGHVPSGQTRARPAPWGPAGQACGRTARQRSRTVRDPVPLPFSTTETVPSAPANDPDPPVTTRCLWGAGEPRPAAVISP